MLEFCSGDLEPLGGIVERKAIVLPFYHLVLLGAFV